VIQTVMLGQLWIVFVLYGVVFPLYCLERDGDMSRKSRGKTRRTRHSDMKLKGTGYKTVSEMDSISQGKQHITSRSERRRNGEYGERSGSYRRMGVGRRKGVEE
jgi:hypothetical protein